ncbi:Spy/CpxP family protein refolding chaperone [Fulvivirga lutea]|uniref:Periplasmic heavy metal sensor n=1 Tax=Fulvivirga lutea TaxID=2810512 RepID=A0A974WI54_9BACT|nr:periplasmic heavy metal sensor [Fulvivirga lutea]QSE97657.1 periplasmic heavy metal sensor [Fulvivirga lutea]
MKKLKSTALSLLIVIGGFTFASAQHGPMHGHRLERGMDDGERGPRIPDLTEEQESKMKELRIAFKDEIRPIENELNEKRAKLKTLTEEENVDRKKVMELVEEMGELKTKLDKREVNHRLDVKQILTKEQQLFLEKRHEDKRGDRHKRH